MPYAPCGGASTLAAGSRAGYSRLWGSRFGETSMTAHQRKAVGGVLTLLFLAAYIWAATVIGEAVPKIWWSQLAYYVITGVAWGLPLIPLMRWMNRGG